MNVRILSEVLLRQCSCCIQYCSLLLLKPVKNLTLLSVLITNSFLLSFAERGDVLSSCDGVAKVYRCYYRKEAGTSEVRTLFRY
jgi:hypothetical protein